MVTQRREWTHVFPESLQHYDYWGVLINDINEINDI